MNDFNYLIHSGGSTSGVHGCSSLLCESFPAMGVKSDMPVFSRYFISSLRTDFELVVQ